ncbi:DUF4304 domain-containing protein [Methylomonas sp. HW2-6]|uniref:DUF4304 domain-containing protein n=1 Tax=Methylomonas sp. HW2-6 TaxID=3376687 RepID=UPI0040423C16
MSKSEVVIEVDAIQSSIRNSLKEFGFKVRGRTFNRQTPDGLTQVINFQMGQSEPPGSVFIPGLKENFYGLFTVNLGVYVPEVAEFHGGCLAKSWVQEYNCCIRDRLGPVSGLTKDIWWRTQNTPAVTEDIRTLLLTFGLNFLNRFESRACILKELEGAENNLSYCNTPRIVSSIIYTKQNEIEKARNLLLKQVLETHNIRHPEYVRALAIRLGLGVI